MVPHILTSAFFPVLLEKPLSFQWCIGVQHASRWCLMKLRIGNRWEKRTLDVWKNTNDDTPFPGLPEKPLDSGGALVLDTCLGGVKWERGNVTEKFKQWYHISFLHQCLLAQTCRTLAFGDALLLGTILGWKRVAGKKNISCHQKIHNNVVLIYILSHCFLLSWASRKGPWLLDVHCWLNENWKRGGGEKEH